MRCLEIPKIRVEVEVRPTEDMDKVKKALYNVFDPEHIDIIERSNNFKLIVAESSSFKSLVKLHDLLRRERILDTARSILKRATRGNTIIFKINKQAAFQGRLSFSEEDVKSPLGPITFIIECRDPNEVIDWLAPPTSKGQPIWEKKMPLH